jgi:hypothetical protein
MPSKTDIANFALDKLTQPPIDSIEGDSSKAERIASRHFNQVVREIGARIPWNVLTKYADLVQSGTPPFKWGYSYALPANFIRVNRFNQYRIDIQVNEHFTTDAKFLYTDSDTAQVEYNEFTDNTGLFDPLLVDAVASLLALRMAPSLLGSTADIEKLNGLAEISIGKASTVNNHQSDDLNVMNQVFQHSRILRARRFSTNG